MTDLARLLDVQAHDTTIDQLHHRRDNLPQRAEAKALAADRKALASARDQVAGRRDEVAERQAKLESDIAASEARITEIDKRMYSGEVSASRDLLAMSTEIQHIKERISALEDRALETMDEREPLDAEVAALDERGAELAARAERLAAEVAEEERVIEADLESEARARDAAAAGVEAGLLTTYTKLRTRLGGVGAARLEHGTCMGCRLQLPATELDRMKKLPADAVVHCEQCGRILVR